MAATEPRRTLEVYDDSRGPGRCKGCKAPLEWATLVQSGSKMCFTGSIVEVDRRTDERGRVIIKADFSNNHWADCPAKDQFKRRGR